MSLFVGAVTLATNLITLVYFLFEGQLSLRFLLKVLVLFRITGEPYGYAVRGETVYELSAEFALRRDFDDDVFWNHPAGRHVFRIDALDPP